MGKELCDVLYLYMSMSWQQIFVWSKKIHRVAMWFAIVLGVPLALTGVIMENDGLYYLVSSWDYGYKTRELHRIVSNKFALVLAVMMTTGFLMWAIPLYLKKKNSETKKR